MQFETMSRRVFLGSAMAATCTRASATVPTLDRLIARNTAARGGAQRLNVLRSMEAIVRITEPSFSVIGRYLADASGLVRVDIYADGKRVFTEGVDAAGAWELHADSTAAKEGTEKGMQALLHGIEFNLIGLNRMAGRGHRLALASPAEDSGRYVVQLMLKDGFETQLFISRENWQIVARQDRRAYHVDVDPTAKNIESRFSDFRRTGGIVSPFRGQDIDLDTGKEVGRNETLRVGWNVATEGRFPRDAVPLPAPAL